MKNNDRIHLSPIFNFCLYIYIYIYIYERNVDQDICLDIRTVIKQSMNWEEGMNAQMNSAIR